MAAKLKNPATDIRQLRHTSSLGSRPLLVPRSNIPAPVARASHVEFAPIRALTKRTGSTVVRSSSETVTVVTEQAQATTILQTVKCNIVVPSFAVKFGEELAVVGSISELGSWDASKAPAMTWGEGHTWSLMLDLPTQSIDFKVNSLASSNAGRSCLFDCVHRLLALVLPTTALEAFDWHVLNGVIIPHTMSCSETW